jgi:hypothetical protein
MTATAEQPPIGRGGGRRRSDRCRGDDRRRDAYDDYAYRGAGKDDAPVGASPTTPPGVVIETSWLAVLSASSGSLQLENSKEGLLNAAEFGSLDSIS